MDDSTADLLLALNQRFYSEFAPVFAASRPVGDAALGCILPYTPPAARVLDVGCGNGRLASLLDTERPGAHYVGVDVIDEMIVIARAAAAELHAISCEFWVLDVARPGWSAALQGEAGAGLPERRFDVVTALAVLHHIPGLGRRAALLAEMAGLLRPGGRLVVSTWQFLEAARLQRKLVPWSEIGVAEARLEPGDYLLDWRRGGCGLRYCHLVDEAELQRLAQVAGLAVRETFRAGGQEGNLSLFGVLEPVGSG